MNRIQKAAVFFRCAAVSASIVFFFSSCFLLPKEEEVLAPPLIEPPEVSYQTEAVERGTIEDVVRVSGSFVSAEERNLFYRYRGGRIKELSVRLGQDIQAGEVVAELHTDNLEYEIERKKLDLEKAQMNLEALKNKSAVDYDAKTADLDLQAAGIKLEELKDRMDKEDRLGSVGGSSEADRKALEREIRLQEIQVEKIRLRKEKLLREGESDTAQRIAEIQVTLAEMELENLLREREQALLTAPISGRVVYVSSSAEEGEYVAAYQNLVKIADPNTLFLHYSGSDANEFHLGDIVEVEIDEKEYTGTVVMTALNVPFEERDDYEDNVFFSVSELPSEVGMGTRAAIRLYKAKREDVIVIPRRAVFRYGTRRYVQVLEDGLRVERDVEIGLETSTDAEIIKGLSEGDLIIVR
jgi:macrolide-specific efflux system membrane fusion protein